MGEEGPQASAAVTLPRPHKRRSPRYRAFNAACAAASRAIGTRYGLAET